MKKNLTRILCCVLVGLVACGAAFAITACKKDDKPSNTGSLIVSPGEQNEIISLFAGPSSGTNEYTLTVQLNDDCPDSMKAIDWSIAWKNPSSEWASGKIVTDYVTATPTADGALTAKVAKVAAFGEQVLVTATARYASDISATATVDCLKSKPVATAVKDATFGQNFEYPTITFSDVGTLTPDVVINGSIYYNASKDPSVVLTEYSFANGTTVSKLNDDFLAINSYLSESSYDDYLWCFGATCNKVMSSYIFIAKFITREPLTIDSFFWIDEVAAERVMKTAAYITAYNAAFNYLTSGDAIPFGMSVSLSYNGKSLGSKNVPFTCKINKGNASPLSVVKSVAFVDSQIIF